MMVIFVITCTVAKPEPFTDIEEALKAIREEIIRKAKGKGKCKIMIEVLR